MLGKVGHVAVVREHPAPVLEGVAVEHANGALRGLAHVGEHGLTRDHAADRLKHAIAQGRDGAAREVRRALDVVRDAPAVRMLLGQVQTRCRPAPRSGALGSESRCEIRTGGTWEGLGRCCALGRASVSRADDRALGRSRKRGRATPGFPLQAY